MRLRDARGFTLVELLIVMSLALVLLGATLTTFDSGYRKSRETDLRNDSAEVARNSLDRLARQLRNLAQRVNSPVIDTVTPYDFIFQTSDPARTWVRYCLSTTAPASAQRGQLWEAQSTSSAVSASMRGACPGSGWDSSRVVTDNVVNRISGQDRPVFTYSCAAGAAGCPASAADYDRILNVSSVLYVDTTPTTGPPELRVATGVFMRNQNQAPTAAFSAYPGSKDQVILNASASDDYEGRTLDYYWFASLLPTTASIQCANAATTLDSQNRTIQWGGNLIGEGVTLTPTFASSYGSATSIELVVCDPGDRYGVATSTVAIPR